MTERRQVTPAGVLFRSRGPIHRKIHAGIVGLTVWEILTQSAQRGFAFAAGSPGVWEVGASGGSARQGFCSLLNDSQAGQLEPPLTTAMTMLQSP